ncbi:MAG: ATP-binding cassette domain-containing protein [Alphaproteobacteria bacterium]|jgi:tungstate transport system ATP-binding protein|nr:ATP-binding cassette domain-containing protein [Alphaproteobacteria bacterium]MBT7942685.1 ATP-binding cassette domain-containing protein [Alphaproteobacteria bacterium]
MSAQSPSILPLELDGVCFEAGGTRLIKDLTWRCEGNRRTIVIGPNGAGKSLFLRLCHGLLAPSQGTVRWQPGIDAARHQAMVFQRPVMLRRSVADNVDYALKLRRVAHRERAEIIDRVLHETGLKRLATQPARVLSIGEQQKLALARAWALNPQVLFLDEPTASLDPAATHGVEEIIEAIHSQGTRIIMTTHDLGQARRMADEVVFINRGRILEAAPAKPFFEAPKNDLAQAFLQGELLWWNKGKDNRRHHPEGERPK